ncbi:MULTISPECIES: sensor histidine kinase [Nocardiopsidaceae]|uniref:Histidine kinase n=1 Tax=Streptomonospora nanhaiensis TaxID=1323731 RepID=A0ABY6YP55_9ACTN|nr:ATP-binding protein [Streptomonospora nanhaiensis]WAE74104.1 histidine kinase [Streptomonospora nanhaiensis]
MHGKDSAFPEWENGVLPPFPENSHADSFLRRTPELVGRLSTRLFAEHNPLRTDPESWPYASAWAASVIRDSAWSLHHGRPSQRVNRMTETYWAELEGESWAIHPRHTGQAARFLFEEITAALPPDAPSAGVRAALVTAQNETTLRMEAAQIRANARFLSQEQAANQEFRRFLARELHDRLGSSVSLANRQLELYELLSAHKPDAKAHGRLRALKGALLELNQQLRVLISDQRRSERAGSLETALRSYADSLDLTVPEVRMDFSGEESWVPPHFLDELFLVLRECLRNSVRHAGAAQVHIAVRLDRTEVRAIASDDGSGFDVEAQLARGSEDGASTGLTSLSERITALGGRVRFLSSPEDGTRTMILVPITTPSIGAESAR